MVLPEKSCRQDSLSVSNAFTGSRENGPIHLGYADEPNQYANNGFWGKDNGIDGQCRGVEAAWVVIGIDRTNK